MESHSRLRSTEAMFKIGGLLSSLRYKAQGCQVRDFIPRSREFSGLLGFFSGIFFGEKISGKFSGFLENLKKSPKRKLSAISQNNV